MVSKILIPIDGSEPSFSALDYAVNEAKTHNASLEILHVMTFTEDLPDSKQQQI
jgi:nucleotide-binding universal stress UspA family protein